jgi:hypothetical protein
MSTYQRRDRWNLIFKARTSGQIRWQSSLKFRSAQREKSPNGQDVRCDLAERQSGHKRKDVLALLLCGLDGAFSQYVQGDRIFCLDEVFREVLAVNQRQGRELDLSLQWSSRSMEAGHERLRLMIQGEEHFADLAVMSNDPIMRIPVH